MDVERKRALFSLRAMNRAAPCLHLLLGSKLMAFAFLKCFQINSPVLAVVFLCGLIYCIENRFLCVDQGRSKM